MVFGDVVLMMVTHVDDLAWSDTPESHRIIQCIKGKFPIDKEATGEASAPRNGGRQASTPRTIGSPSDCHGAAGQGNAPTSLPQTTLSMPS